MYFHFILQSTLLPSFFFKMICPFSSGKKSVPALYSVHRKWEHCWYHLLESLMIMQQYLSKLCNFPDSYPGIVIFCFSNFYTVLTFLYWKIYQADLKSGNWCHPVAGVPSALWFHPSWFSLLATLPNQNMGHWWNRLSMLAACVLLDDDLDNRVSDWNLKSCIESYYRRGFTQQAETKGLAYFIHTSKATKSVCVCAAVVPGESVHAVGGDNELCNGDLKLLHKGSLQRIWCPCTWLQTLLYEMGYATNDLFPQKEKAFSCNNLS